MKMSKRTRGGIEIVADILDIIAQDDECRTNKILRLANLNHRQFRTYVFRITECGSSVRRLMLEVRSYLIFSSNSKKYGVDIIADC